MTFVPQLPQALKDFDKFFVGFDDTFNRLSYFCLFLGPALAVIGVINHRRIQAKEAEITKAGGTVKTYYTTDTFGPGPKSQTQTPPHINIS